MPGAVAYKRQYKRERFDCGEESLNVWLRTVASSAAKGDTARTYVVLDGNEVIGYYAVCTSSLAADEAPEPVQVGRLDIPAILLARLAVDTRYQGRGLGEELLLDALIRAVAVADAVGARVVIVHALHERAGSFYERAGFLRFESQPLHMYMLMKDVRRTLEHVGLLGR
jgi:GNAT superfamily N-acetyltransferase